ncbi:cell division protein FtsQ/DivIB [Sphingobium sp. AN641]|uniref:cell division protein FtsQ/DivIB n=1 Tax=Sphingobium sp. AN641 TaxID=3133443 RepID=UPI0030BE5327
MSEARIRRGGSARLGNPRSKVRVRSAGRERSLKRQSRFDRLLDALPISAASLQRLATWAIVAVVAGLAGLAAIFFGLPGMVHQEAAELAARSGFEVQKVEVQGVERMDELPVYNIALGQVDRSMLALDLPKVRGEMLKLGWVKDARISRRLPDTLVVDIVERQPVAVWQHHGQLHLIDVGGAVLEEVAASAMPDLPLVVGPNANRQTAGLNRLMENAPALKPMLAGATWVGNRRWDLRFQSGETLSLPEGDKASSGALVNFARMDGVNRLLGRGIVRFDMRDPDRFVLRLPQQQSAKDDAATAKAAGAGEEG